MHPVDKLGSHPRRSRIYYTILDLGPMKHSDPKTLLGDGGVYLLMFLPCGPFMGSGCDPWSIGRGVITVVVVML